MNTLDARCLISAIASCQHEIARLRRLSTQTPFAKDMLCELQKRQDKLIGDLKTLTAQDPLYIHFLSHVKGIAEMLACKIISLGLDPTKEVSSWNAYAGLSPIYYMGTCEDNHKRLYPKEPYHCVCGKSILAKKKVEHAIPTRQRGWIGFWNPHARVVMHNVAISLMRSGRFYKHYYKLYKSQAIEQNKERPAIIARTKLKQLFLYHLHQASRELVGLPPTKTYAFEYLQFQHPFPTWHDVVNIDGID